MNRIAIGVSSYRGAQRLGWLLESIALRTPEIEEGRVVVVVVDDGSPEPDLGRTREVVHTWDARGVPIVYIEHGRNRGIPAGWNSATRATDAPYVVMINDDVIVVEHWLRGLVHVLEHSPDVGVVGVNWHAFLPEDVPALLSAEREVVPRDPESKAQVPTRRADENCNPGRVMCPTGQLFAFRRADFDAIGGFDENLKSFYEESLFGSLMAARLRKIGVQLSGPAVWHQWSASFAANPELQAGERLNASRAYYRRFFNVPEGTHEFDYVNQLYFDTIGDVDVEWLRPNGDVVRGTLKQDRSYVDRQAGAMGSSAPIVEARGANGPGATG